MLYSQLQTRNHSHCTLSHMCDSGCLPGPSHWGSIQYTIRMVSCSIPSHELRSTALSQSESQSRVRYFTLAGFYNTFTSWLLVAAAKGSSNPLRGYPHWQLANRRFPQVMDTGKSTNHKARYRWLADSACRAQPLSMALICISTYFILHM